MASKDIEQQFIEAYDNLADDIFRHCYFKISDRERAKDLMQETFTRVWDYLCGGGEIEYLKAFLYKTANNLIIDEYRKKKTQSLDALSEKGFDLPDSEHLRTELVAEGTILRKALEKLEESYRQVVVMRHIDGLSPKEIAEILEETENAVSVRINRGISKLRGILKV